MIRLIAAVFGSLFALLLIGAAGVAVAFYAIGQDLPDYRQLADYDPPVTTRFYTADGRLLNEYAVQNRVFVPIDATPRRVIHAFLSAEDKNFYQHPGVDIFGIARAAVTNVKNLGTGRRLQGASTITQQVAKNFLVGSEVSMNRKLKEAVLAFRMEQAFSKDRILELYLNEIYLGRGSYGVTAAALNYFNRSLDELSIAETAFLAGLPKAPSNYDPIRNPEEALERRNWVIGRMLEDGVITAAEAEEARNAPIQMRWRDETEAFAADYFAEEVRREIGSRYGETALYEGGLVVRTTLDPALQDIADRVLREGLTSYDRRHGWRGPIARIDIPPSPKSPQASDEVTARLDAVPKPAGLGDWKMAVVVALDAAGADIVLGGRAGRIPLEALTWARPWREGQHLGPAVERPADVLAVGDVVAVEVKAEDGAAAAEETTRYALRQIPDVEGALVALDPHTGRVLAMSGGYSYERSEFNRATQAYRQPGSAFKPFVYLAALEDGFTPTTIILDAPFIIDQGPGLPKWRPANYTNRFYGPTTMRIGLEKSRNLMTVRLAQTIGMERVAETAERFDIVDDMPPHLSFALGAAETTLLRLSSAYGMLVNGGKRITPSLIDRVQDRHGRTIYRHDGRDCSGCRSAEWRGQPAPALPDPREAVTDPASAYQVVSMLQGVVQRGTGTVVADVGKPLAGKTGTTNDSKDTWFVGFSPDLVVGVFVGFDDPKPLGSKETGSSAAAPIFRDFMAAALAEEPAIPFRVPPGIRLVRIDRDSGRLAASGDRHVILEAFKPGNEPDQQREILSGAGVAVEGPAMGTGGLY
ncbi:MAG: penicillin-binding protein 1A [Rhodospirillales bacterium]|nr:penicillin-binding protein 1A [Rhodospirillales bacterium]